MSEVENLRRILDREAHRIEQYGQELAEQEREIEKIRGREASLAIKLDHIEAHCSDYVDDISISHQAMRGICEIIGMEWRGDRR